MAPPPSSEPPPDPRGETLPLPDSDLDRSLARARVREALFGVKSAEQVVGRYLVLGTVGRGGMGVVLEAFDRSLDRRIALKLLHEDIAQQHRERLVREAKALAKLSHPNVVQVYEVGTYESQTFIAMELVEGRSLEAWQAEQLRPWRAVVQTYLQAGRGLAAAHAQGLVHRDFKPGNCVIDDRGRVRVLDFGLVRDVEADGGSREAAVTDEDLQRLARHVSATLTRTGAVVGTLAYISPEQLAGRSVDARADQFSFCVALYEALYGERPFDEGAVLELVEARETGRVRPAPRGTRVPLRVRRVLLRGLAPTPERRWPSVERLLIELARLARPRWTRWAVPAMLGAGAAMAGGSLWQASTAADACAGIDNRLDGVWDDARREQVRASILGTALPYASDTWERVEAKLDAHRKAWLRRSREVCEATHVRREQPLPVMDLREQCLARIEVDLREAVDVLGSADAQTVEGAVRLASGLPDPARCDDVEALRAELPPPQDPALAESAARLRERLSGAEARQRVGQYGQAMALIQPVVDEAEGLGYGPLLAEALVLRGDVHDDLGQYEEAVRDLGRAYLLATEHRHDQVEGKATRQLTWVVGHQQQKLEAAQHWGDTALALARRSTSDALDDARALTTMGVLFFERGELQQATEHHTRALELVLPVKGPEDLEVSSIEGNLGMALMHLGHPDEAMVHHRRSLTIAEQALGSEHPDIARALNNLGLQLGDAGRWDEAVEHYQRALAIWEEALGPDHPNVALVLTNLGNARAAQGRHTEALGFHRRVSAMYEATLEADHPDRGRALVNIGNALSDLGQLSEARDHYERARTNFERALGPDHFEVGKTWINIGNILAKEEQLEEALRHFVRSREIFERALGPDHPFVAICLGSIARAEHLLGRDDAAQADYEAAKALFEARLGPGHPHVARILRGMAKVALAKGDRATARGHAERAVEIWGSSEGTPSEVAEARFLLAQSLGTEPDPRARARARALAEQARDGLTAASPPEDKTVAEIVEWLASHPAIDP